MEYYIAIFIIFWSSFLITELVRTFVFKKKFRVTIKRKDGSLHTFESYAGRDPEIDKLIAKAKAGRKAEKFG